MGESLTELRNDIHYFLKAFQKPVLIEAIKNGKEVPVVDEEASEINSGHYPELLDRSWVATDYLYQLSEATQLCVITKNYLNFIQKQKKHCLCYIRGWESWSNESPRRKRTGYQY